MSYVSKTLLEGEKVCYQARLHWWIYILPSVFIMVSVYLLFGEFAVFIQCAAGALLIISIWNLLNRIVLALTSDFIVTNKRVILKTGLIRRSLSELQLNKAEGIIFDESLFGRVLGYGTILVTTGGITNRYPYIESPMLFGKAINEGIDNINN